MRIAIRTNQRCDFDPVAADAAHEVGEHGEAGDNPKLLVGSVGARHDGAERQHEGKNSLQHRSHCNHASRCLPGKARHTSPPTLPNITDAA